jgi:hypothetical protein
MASRADVVFIRLMIDQAALPGGESLHPDRGRDVIAERVRSMNYSIHGN